MINSSLGVNRTPVPYGGPELHNKLRVLLHPLRDNFPAKIVLSGRGHLGVLPGTHLRERERGQGDNGQQYRPNLSRLLQRVQGDRIRQSVQILKE